MTTAALRAGCLNFWEVLAQSVAMLGPTMTPVLIVPIAFAAAGNVTWLAYAFGTVMLLAVALCLREFARRSATAGSLYAYTERAFGGRGAMFSGWCLLWAYAFVAVAGMTGFAVFASALLGPLGNAVPPLALSVACLLLGWCISYYDIRLSTITLLVLEGVSVSLITVLLFFVFAHNGVVDPDQLHLRGGSISAIALGAVICVFSLVGFESATALGEEARDPLRTIPAAVAWSVIVSGVFFVICIYVEVLGTRNYPTALDKLTTPLATLSSIVGAPYLRIPIFVGALFSAFSVALASINAGARIVYAMGRSGLLPRALGAVHEGHRSPYIALTAFAAVNSVVAVALLIVFHRTAAAAFGDTATLSAFGFVVVYFFIVAGMPVYVHRLGGLRRRHIALAAIAALLLLVPAVGSVYPIPPPPGNAFPYVFLGYLILGVALLWRRSGRVATGDDLGPWAAKRAVGRDEEPPPCGPFH